MTNGSHIHKVLHLLALHAGLQFALLRRREPDEHRLASILARRDSRSCDLLIHAAHAGRSYRASI